MFPRLLLGVTIVLALLYVYVPLGVVVLFSFHESGGLSFPFEVFSLRWYREVFGSHEFVAALRNSLSIAAATTAITIALGTAAAYGMSRTTSRFRSLLTPVFFAPITLPGIFLGIALLLYFRLLDFQLSFWTVVIAHTVYVAPFFYLIVSIALDRLDPALDDAALDLGASRQQVFFKVTLPQVWPSILGAAVLVFMLSFDEFIITFFVIGNDGTLPLYIFSKLRKTVDPTINVVSTMLIVSSLLLWLVGLLMVRSQKKLAAR